MLHVAQVFSHIEGSRICRLEVYVTNILWGYSQMSEIVKHFIAATDATDRRLLR